MHEVSLNRVITDYISGSEIPDTTYEDLRQALARMLVEDKKYPRACVRPKHDVMYEVDGQTLSVAIDIAVFAEDGRPLLALFFCPGEIGSFVRESLAAARIHRPEPFPLVAVTDSMDIVVVATRTGDSFGSGFNAVPRWPDLAPLAEAHPLAPLPEERRGREGRILYAYDGLGGPCCGGACEL